MLQFLLQLPAPGLPQQISALPEIPPGPSLERVRGPVEIPLLETWQVALIAVFAISAITLISWWGFNCFRARKNRIPLPPPHSAAIAELKIAVELATGDDQRFAVLSSQALRRYFEIGRGIDTLGKTTDEFLKGLETHDLLKIDERKLLSDFLHHCDRVKFARESLSESERLSLVESAVNLIQKCEQATKTTAENNVQS